MDGYFWYEANGLLSVPWFTPSFCGGLPKFPNPQALYFSVPQLLVFFVDPLQGIRLTLLLFGFVGLAGTYALLRRAFAVSRPVALFGGTLFLFNGLYAHRMLIGHLTFHSFMLVPVLALLLLRPVGPAGGKHPGSFAFDVASRGPSSSRPRWRLRSARSRRYRSPP